MTFNNLDSSFTMFDSLHDNFVVYSLVEQVRYDFSCFVTCLTNSKSEEH